jgi:hypothetical protein
MLAACLLLVSASSAWAAPIERDSATTEKTKSRQGIACATAVADRGQRNGLARPVVRNCSSSPVSHEGHIRIRWVLDPDTPPPGPASESIVVAVHERGCTGGRNPIPYLQRPEVRYLKQAVVITLWIEVLEGFATCPGNPIGRLEVKLPGPLGARQLYDGSTDPPRKVEYGEDPRRWYSPS